MKQILVPTDFSKPAHRAIEYAIDFANHFGSRITLLHTYKVYSTAGMLVSVEGHIREQASRDLLDLAREVEPRLQNGARLDTKLLYGDAVPSISRLADREWSGYHPRAMAPIVFAVAVASLVVWTGRWYLSDLSDLAARYGPLAVFALAWGVWPALLAVFLYRTVAFTYRLADGALLLDYGF